MDKTDNNEQRNTDITQKEWNYRLGRPLNCPHSPKVICPCEVRNFRAEEGHEEFCE